MKKYLGEIGDRQVGFQSRDTTSSKILFNFHFTLQ
jgi:hypothetical protein